MDGGVTAAGSSPALQEMVGVPQPGHFRALAARSSDTSLHMTTGDRQEVSGTVKLYKEKGAMMGAVCDRRGTGCCHHEVRISKSILKKNKKKP